LSSVQHTNGDYLASADEPTITGDWTIGCWVKINSYSPGANAPVISWDNTSEFIVFYVPSGGTVLTALIFDGDTSDSVNVLTGSDASWVFVSFRHASGSSNYVVSWRQEGETSLTHDTLTTGVQITGPTQIRIGANGIDEFSVDSSSRSYFARSDLLSDGDLLTASTSLGAPTGTNQAVLDLDSPTNAGDNTGTGSDYSVTGTLGTDGTEPDPSIGGGAVIALPALLGSGF